MKRGIREKAEALGCTFLHVEIHILVLYDQYLMKTPAGDS